MSERRREVRLIWSTICRALCVLAASSGAASALSPIDLDSRHGEYRVGERLEVLEDPEGRLTIDAVASPPISASFAGGTSDVPNYGLTKSAYWVRFELRRQAGAGAEWRLEVAWPVADRIDVYLPDGAGGFVEIRGGEQRPFTSWDVPYRNPTFRIRLPDDSARTVYMRFSGEDTMLLPITLWSAAAFAEKRRGEASLYGFYYGVLAVLIIYNLVLLCTLRDRTYLYYVLLVAAWALYHASLNGFATQYLWPASPTIARWSIHIAAMLAFTFAGLFARSFLMTVVHAPVLDRWLLVLTTAGATFVLWPLFGSVRSFVVVGGVTGLTSAALMVVSGVRCWLAGYRPARYYVLTWTVGIAALFVWGLRGYGFLPSNIVTDRAFEMVVLSTAITLSLGLADRINVLRAGLEASVREKGALLDALQELNRDLERRIDERTATLARRSEELAEKTGQLEIANRHKSAFVAHMSHELRTPLNAIIGFSELLRARMFGELNQKQQEYVDDILDSGRHLLALINDVLDLSKVEAGRMELELAPLDLPEVIDGALTLVRERAHKQGIALRRELDADVGEMLGDERKIKQVLVNLLSNAVKFTPSGGTVWVRATRHNGAFEIAVQDTGIGIAPEDQQAIFEEFTQGSGESRTGEGTGLGLSLARRLVELHGGRISVASRVGEGATFTFTVPVG
jgi:signal transduction histidine kinase